jgi:hypothetical protein
MVVSALGVPSGYRAEANSVLRHYSLGWVVRRVRTKMDFRPKVFS